MRMRTLSNHLHPTAGLPAEVLSTPFGQMIAPMLSGLEEQMRSMRTQAYRPHIEAAAAAALAGAPAATTSDAAAAAAPAVEAAAPAAGAAAAEPAAEPAVPAAGPAGGAAGPTGGPLGAAGAAEEQEGSGLRSAEVEIEASVAAGMIQEAEQALSSLELQPGAGQQPEAAAVAPPAGEPVASAAAAAAPAAPSSATGDKLVTEWAVESEFKRLVAADMAEHEAQALALEAVAAAAGSVTDNPVQHSLGTDGAA